MLGFSGGLVPGVEVYAYACHPVVRRWVATGSRTAAWSAGS